MRRPLAETDILEIWDYIADDSLAAADRWVDRIDEQLSLLAAQPMYGSGSASSPGRRSGATDQVHVLLIPERACISR